MQLAEAMNAITDGIAVVGLNQQFLFVNDALLRDYGYCSSLDLLHKPWEILCANEEVSRIRREACPLLGRHEAWIGEVTTIQKDGTPKMREVRLKPTKSGETVCVFYDETERKRAEDLKATTSLLRATLDSTADGILVIDRNGKILSYNRVFAHLWRIPDSVLEKNDDKKALEIAFRQLKDPEAFLRRVHELYSNPEEKSSEILEFKDGRVFERYSIPQYIDGAPVGRVWSFRDVTERVELLSRERRARAQAEADERRSAFLAEAGNILDASLDYEQTLDTVAHLVVPKMADWCAIEIFEPETPRALKRVSSVGLGNCPLKDCELTDNRDRAMDSGKTAVLGNSRCLTVPLKARGKTLGFVTFGSLPHAPEYDSAAVAFGEALAHKAALAIDNARLYLEAQENIRARHEFISVASHELKTPITSLQGYIQLLQKLLQRKDVPVSTDTLYNMAHSAEQQCRRLIRFLESLLDISRISADKLRLEIEQVNLSDALRDVLQRLRQSIQDEGYQIDLRCPTSLIGYWDRLRIDQIITNLVTNAIKYGAKRPIEITAEPLEGGVLLRVRDHGIGISKENQARIFKSFERAVSGRTYGGTGLGLWIVRQIVEAHGGHIRVCSEPGQGSTFEVLLPQRSSQLATKRSA